VERADEKGGGSDEGGTRRGTYAQNSNSRKNTRFEQEKKTLRDE